MYNLDFFFRDPFIWDPLICNRVRYYYIVNYITDLWTVSLFWIDLHASKHMNFSITYQPNFLRPYQLKGGGYVFLWLPLGYIPHLFYPFRLPQNDQQVRKGSNVRFSDTPAIPYLIKVSQIVLITEPGYKRLYPRISQGHGNFVYGIPAHGTEQQPSSTCGPPLITTRQTWSWTSKAGAAVCMA